ncbi:hypothetical protein OSTOST_17873 [Ostertagia ostertagi]
MVKEGNQDIEGLTDKVLPRRLGPKRASKIRNLFNLSKEDDVTKFVITHEKARGEGPRNKTQQRNKSYEEAAAYNKLMTKFAQEVKDQKVDRRRSSASRSPESDVKKAAKK